MPTLVDCNFIEDREAKCDRSAFGFFSCTKKIGAYPRRRWFPLSYRRQNISWQLEKAVVGGGDCVAKIKYYCTGI